MAILGGGAVSHERGTPVVDLRARVPIEEVSAQGRRDSSCSL
jgi:hypothetical protein